MTGDSRCDYADLVQNLRETLRHLDTVRALSPENADLPRLREALRERVASLEMQSQNEQDHPMAA